MKQVHVVSGSTDASGQVWRADQISATGGRWVDLTLLSVNNDQTAVDESERTIKQ